MTMISLKLYRIIGTLPIEVDMNRMPNLDLEEEEPPPPLPARSANMYTDAPSHTLDSGSQGSNPGAASALLPPSLNNERLVPALPPKPAHMKLVGTNLSYALPVDVIMLLNVGLQILQQLGPAHFGTETSRF